MDEPDAGSLHAMGLVSLSTTGREIVYRDLDSGFVYDDGLYDLYLCSSRRFRTFIHLVTCDFFGYYIGIAGVLLLQRPKVKIEKPNLRA